MHKSLEKDIPSSNSELYFYLNLELHENVIYVNIIDCRSIFAVVTGKDPKSFRRVVNVQKKRIAVIFGGKSSEHEVSRVSASYVISKIPEDKYDIIMIGITKDGKWLMYNGDIKDIADGSWENNLQNKTAFISPDPSIGGITIITDNGCEIIKLDCAFPILHGKNGEDGTIQGLFELAEIPYVGCGVLASADCMDKIVTNIIFDYAGIEQAGFTWFYSSDYFKNPDKYISEVEKNLEYPVFVKPANAGSSVGVSKAASREELKAAVIKAAKEDGRILIEENIIGKEVECAVLGNDEPFASVPGQIAPAAEFYDYDAKYNNPDSKLFIPAQISEELMEKVKKTAMKAYRTLGCTGLSRVDFFVTDDGRVLLNEINTLPGFTSISMYPKLMEASGTDGSSLIERLIELAFERTGKNV